MAESNSCQPCSVLDEHSVGTNWCVECDFILCSRCSKLHKIIPSLNSHTILDKNVYLNASFDFSVMKCKTHTDHQLEFSCEKDQQFCCQLCLSDNHKSCKNITPLNNASKNVKQSAYFTESIVQLEKVANVYENLSTDRNDNKKEIIKQVEGIKQKIHLSKQKALQKIDDAEKSVLIELARLEKDVLKRLETDEICIKSKSENCKNLKRQANFISQYGSDKQVFIFLESLNRTLQESEYKAQEEVKTFKTFFIDIGGSGNSIMTLSSMLKTIEKPCRISFKPYKLKQAQTISMHHLNTKLKTLNIERKVKVKFPDLSVGKISSMAFSTCDKLLLTDCRHGGKLLLCNNDVNVMKSLDMKGNFPWDISIFPNTSIAVAQCLSQYLEFIDFNVGKSSSFTVECNSEMSGVWATDKNVFELQYSKIKCLDLKGKCLSEVDLPITTRHDIESYIHVHQNGNMYISFDRQVLCVRMDGTMVFTYSPNNLRSANKITSDENGVVYVVDEYSNNVHRLTEDGRFVDTILDGKLTAPRAICFNKDFNRCYISGDSGKSVYICDCS